MSLYGLSFPPTFMKFLDYPSQTQDNKQIKLQKTKGNDKKKCIHIVLKTIKTTLKIKRLWKQGRILCQSIQDAMSMNWI